MNIARMRAFREHFATRVIPFYASVCSPAPIMNSFYTRTIDVGNRYTCGTVGCIAGEMVSWADRHGIPLPLGITGDKAERLMELPDPALFYVAHWPKELRERYESLTAQVTEDDVIPVQAQLELMLAALDAYIADSSAFSIWPSR